MATNNYNVLEKEDGLIVERKSVTLAQLISAHRRSSEKIEALAQQVTQLVSTGGEPNVITAIKNNGTALEVTDKAVDIGATIAAAVADSDHLKRKVVTGLDAIDVNAADAGQYIYMVLKADAGENDQYDEYMVLDGAVEHVGNTKVDLSGYQAKEEGKGLSSNDFTDEDKAKLDGLTFATDEEVAAALAEIYGTDEA